MTRTKKVYMPLWIAWLMQLFVVPAWGFITYRSFFTGDEPVSGGWVMMTIMMVVVCGMTLLMGYRKLPAYIIEEEDHK